MKTSVESFFSAMADAGQSIPTLTCMSGCFGISRHIPCRYKLCSCGRHSLLHAPVGNGPATCITHRYFPDDLQLSSLRGASHQGPTARASTTDWWHAQQCPVCITAPNCVHGEKRSVAAVGGSRSAQEQDHTLLCRSQIEPGGICRAEGRVLISMLSLVVPLSQVHAD